MERPTVRQNRSQCCIHNIQYVSCYLICLGVIISFMIVMGLLSYFHIENTMPSMSMWLSFNSVLYRSEIPNANLSLTCLSFVDICNHLSIETQATFANISFKDFNSNCVAIQRFIITNKAHLSPLFILSLRREFFINKYYISVDHHCKQIMINVFQLLHSKSESFHHVDRKMLMHTHISKAAGSANFDQIKKIMQQLKESNRIDYEYRVINHYVKAINRYSSFVFQAR
eukprot:794455_1